MPDKWPLANGNWSNPANWNGATKPVAGDDVFADGRTIAIDENIDVASIRTTQRSGGTSGGSFTLAGNGSRTITGNLIAGNGTALAINNWTGGGTLTINGNINGSPSSGFGIAGNGGSYHLVINGNIVGGGGQFTHGVRINSQLQSLTITGNISAGNADISNGLEISGIVGGTIINGNVIGGSFETNNFGFRINFSTGGTIVINGSVIGGSTSFCAGVRNGSDRICIIRDLVFSQNASNVAGVNPPIDGRCFQLAEGGTITMRDTTGVDRVLSATNGGPSRPVNPFTQQVIG